MIYAASVFVDKEISYFVYKNRINVDAFVLNTDGRAYHSHRVSVQLHKIRSYCLIMRARSNVHSTKVGLGYFKITTSFVIRLSRIEKSLIDKIHI